MRFFNTAGPVNCDKHYCLPILERFNLSEVCNLIDQEKYFVLHAPRQTGKTSCLLALMEYLNEGNKYKCIYINAESAQGAREDVGRGIRAVLNELSDRAYAFWGDRTVHEIQKEVLKEYIEDAALNAILTRLCADSKLPIVLLIDEIDSLIGDTLISVLRQIRAGYDKRPLLFPQSIVLCGVRDVRDYRLHSKKEKEIITGGSAFNIKAKSLRLENFSKKNIVQLLTQHTKETGQKFNSDVFDFIWDLSSGQPWLVNALAYEVCFEIKKGKDRKKKITSNMIEQAKENIILRRETHIDQLIDKLREDRVRRVIEPVLAGKELAEGFVPDDVQYAIDLGLIHQDINGEINLTNQIYKEVIPRALSWDVQSGMSEKTSWYILPDGSIDMIKLLVSFQAFFRKHSEHWIERFHYKEAGPQLLLQAFLQRIVNGGGRVEREYGLGRMRTDLLIIWPTERKTQQVVLELKILYGSLDETIKKGLEQTASYIDTCGSEEGHLVVFNRNENTSWDEKIFHKEMNVGEKKIMVWGM